MDHLLGSQDSPGPPRPPGGRGPSILPGHPDDKTHLDLLDHTGLMDSGQGQGNSNLILDTSHKVQSISDTSQSVLQLLTLQQDSNRHLQWQVQKSTIAQQHHTDAFREPTASMYQGNFDHMFPSILIFDGSKRDTFLTGLRITMPHASTVLKVLMWKP